MTHSSESGNNEEDSGEEDFSRDLCLILCKTEILPSLTFGMTDRIAEADKRVNI